MIRLNKILRILMFLLFVVYACYVVAVSVFFNTGIFRRVAGMTEDDQTYVQMRGLVSWWPGYLYASGGEVFIADQNVSIRIQVQNVKARFEVLPLFQKKANIENLHIGNTQVEIGMKELRQSQEYYQKYARPEQLDRKKMEKLVEEYAQARFTLDFKKITIDRIHDIRGGFGEFKGAMSLQGGFRMQPKVTVEVYPTTVKFLEGITGEVKAAFETFKILDAPGNAVFPYVTADIDLHVNTNSLKISDITLGSLPGYSMDGFGSNGDVKIKIVKGVLQKGSSIVTTPSTIAVHTPSLKAEGFGKIRWEVDGKQSSVMKTELSKVKLLDKDQKGAIRSVSLVTRFYGNELVNAFHGVLATVDLKGIEWRLQTDRTKNSNFRYSGVVSGNGGLSGFAGDIPKNVDKLKSRASELNLSIDRLDLDTSFLGKVASTGSVRVSTIPINLLANALQFPSVNVMIDFHLDDPKGEKRTVKTEAKFDHLEHQLAPQDTWKGKVYWTLKEISPLVDAVDRDGKLNGMVKAVAKVSELRFDIDTEMTPKSTWLRFNQVQSSGIWSGYGSLESKDEGLRGLFELKVLGMPLGIRVEPEKSEVKFLPSKEWYDRYLESQKKP